MQGDSFDGGDGTFAVAVLTFWIMGFLLLKKF
jgi:hypothetical protein